MNLLNKKILVTGGSGFIGSHIVDALVEKGAIVTAIDNHFSSNIKNLSQALDKITFKNVDITNEKAVQEVMKGQDIIFHLAANADVPYSVNHPEIDFRINIVGSYNVLKNAVDFGIQKFIFASSAAVYGNPVHTPIDEKHPTNPISPYGASKLAIEKLGMSYYKTYGLPFVAMRIFNTYGERQPRYVMYDLLKKLYKNTHNLEVLGTGEQVRDYSYVTDTANAFILAAENDSAIGEIFNIAGGRSIKIKEVVGLLIETLHIRDIKITYTQKSWQGDIDRLIADLSKIKLQLDFSPQVELDTGIKKLHDWLSRDLNYL